MCVCVFVCVNDNGGIVVEWIKLCVKKTSVFFLPVFAHYFVSFFFISTSTSSTSGGAHHHVHAHHNHSKKEVWCNNVIGTK